MDSSVNPWKLATIGIALVVCTSVITAVVVANWSGRHAELRNDAPSASPSTQADSRWLTAAAMAPSPTASPLPQGVTPAPAAQPRPAAPAVPSQATVEACNRHAASQAPTTTSKTVEIVKDGAIGGALGAAMGAAGGAIVGGGQGAGKGAAIGGLVGVGGGALYGLNENKKDDQRYRQAYAACLRSRGYAG
jgi:hypothetical protein